MINNIFDPAVWASVPFHFWSVLMFILGTMVGSFLNVCIHRMPLGMSIISPSSHCPHCKYSIPAFLNIPLVTWLYLRGKCKNCGAPISIRYFLVELITGLAFLGCWVFFGRESAWVSLVYAVFVSGLIVATFIDFDHFIIPDEITIGGAVAGFIFSFFLPALHDSASLMDSLKRSLIGIAVGAGTVYFILRMGKLLFGRQRVALPAGAKIVFTETSVELPDKSIPYEDIFYRPSDVIVMQAKTVELIDRSYWSVPVRLTPVSLKIGDEELKPEHVPHMEVVSTEMVLPREAMGLGDVKFMAAIGAFLGWQGAVFSLMVSSVIGSIVGVVLIVMRKQAWSSRLPYGPYIAIAAAFWLFGGRDLVEWWFGLSGSR